MRDPKGGTGRNSLCEGVNAPPPRRKTQTYQTLPRDVSTCCCREYMDTSRIKTMGRTCMGESRTTLSGSIVGAN